MQSESLQLNFHQKSSSQNPLEEGNQIENK
jgi:hypothetical protein